MIWASVCASSGHAWPSPWHDREPERQGIQGSLTASYRGKTVDDGWMEEGADGKTDGQWTRSRSMFRCTNVRAALQIVGFVRSLFIVCEYGKYPHRDISTMRSTVTADSHFSHSNHACACQVAVLRYLFIVHARFFALARFPAGLAVSAIRPAAAEPASCAYLVVYITFQIT